MLLSRENGVTKVYAENYSLEFRKDRPFVFLFDAQGNRAAELFVLSGVHATHGRDDTTLPVDAWRVEEGLEEITLTVDAASSVWESKTYRFHCRARRFSYEIEVCGQGLIDQVDYFGGYYSGQVRWGSGYFVSGQRFQHVFNPEPTTDEQYSYPAEASTAINLTGVPLPGKGDWFFTPPPFCFAFELPNQWMGVGVEARAGHNRYTEFGYQGGRNAFTLTLPFEGHTQVDGRYTLPTIGFDFGPDPYTLLASHVQHLRAAGYVDSPLSRSRPEWWHEPLFCGWGAQCYLANLAKGRGPDFSSQENYEGFLAQLDANGIQPGTVVLDDKWQASYGENDVDTTRWPDLPGFVRERHQNGQHVLLWLKAWDPEGVPVEECARNAAGLPLAVDPTHPAFEQRLRASVRRMLSPEGYDADGFKIDFSARIPSGPNIHAYGDAWGLELMRLYLWILHDEAKQVKPDAFIIAHTPHPYLADLVDAIRLNDINTEHDVCRQMTHRARLAAISCPEALIDMDNWPLPSKAAWRAYLQQRPMLGIPALYFASHIDSTQEALNEEDYALLREAWTSYRTTAAAYRRRRAEEKVGEVGGSFLPDGNALVKRLALGHTLPVSTKPLKLPGSEAIHDHS